MFPVHIIFLKSLLFSIQQFSNKWHEELRVMLSAIKCKHNAHPSIHSELSMTIFLLSIENLYFWLSAIKCLFLCLVDSNISSRSILILLCISAMTYSNETQYCIHTEFTCYFSLNNNSKAQLGRILNQVSLGLISIMMMCFISVNSFDLN